MSAQAGKQVNPDGNGDGPDDAKRANRMLVGKLALVVVMMFGFGYALVPFYDQICKATGLRDIAVADTDVNTQVDASRTVRVELDANLNKLPWQFRPLTPVISVHPGELTQVVYEVQNTSERPMTGQAVPSYGPRLAGEYFKKLECFCFTKQSLGPHEKRQMPVVFVIDSRLPADVTTITLSYTFFEVEGNLTHERDGPPLARIPERAARRYSDERDGPPLARQYSNEPERAARRYSDERGPASRT